MRLVLIFDSDLNVGVVPDTLRPYLHAVTLLPYDTIEDLVEETGLVDAYYDEAK